MTPGVRRGSRPGGCPTGRRPRPVPTLVAALAALAVLAVPAGAAPPPPADLTVDGGEDAWHASNSFHLVWRNPAAGSVAAVRYRVRDASGAVAVPQARIEWAATQLWGLRVPRAPGVYTAEVWLEDAGGDQGPPAAAKLRFDDARPGATEPIAPAGWVGRAAFPLTVRLARPGGSPPASGIRGYAVSIGPSPRGEPCAAADRCAEAETDLRGGAADDAFAIEMLPEGTSYVHAVAVSGAGMRSTVTGHAAVRVDRTDPVTRLRGAPRGWTNRAVALLATAADGGAGMEADGAGAGPFTAIRVGGGRPVTRPGDSVRTGIAAEGVHAVAYYARDAAGNVDDGGHGNGIANAPPSKATVRIDRTPPRIAFAAQDPRDPELVRARVRDRLSGADVSRGWIGVRRAGSGDRFAPLPAEPPGEGELRARWDSDAHPAGAYEFRAAGYDAAGNAATGTRRADGRPMTLPSPLKTPTSLQAGFGGRVLVWHRCVRHGAGRRCRRQALRDFGRRPARRLVPFGRGALLGGRLLAGLGAPAAGLPVRVVERFGAGRGARQRAVTVRTGADGAFAVRLAPGPSREVIAVFAGNRTLTRSAARPVRLGVRGGLRLRASATAARVGGRPVVFSGRVAGPPGSVPHGGLSVQLQFRLPGLAWREFRTVRTDRRGRFRYAYRFSDDDSRGARFRFRARAPAQEGWPYEPGNSRPVTVRGI